ncbi:MAG: hypothetical protein ABL929_08625 [Ferruginibacter sp.]|nr:hypothetical protein [Ferruginibacter sp.]
MQLNNELIQQWLNKKMNLQEINLELITKNFDDDLKMSYLKEYKRLRYLKRSFAAGIYLGVGAIIGFLGCVFMVMNIMPHMFDFFLYSSTLIAAGLVFYGLYLLFEG